MLKNFRLGRRVRVTFGCMILCVFSAQTMAANVWESTFGQRWFWEVRAWSGQVLAGTWWEHSLSPGNTYNISFEVRDLRGKMGLLVGNNPVVVIDKPGNYSFDFAIHEGGKRRMIFRTESHDVLAAVNKISVTRKWSSSPSGAGNWIPKGHYLSFDRQRNLKTQMQDLVDRPWTAKTQYELKLASNLHDALKTPGVKGVWMEFDWRSLEKGDGWYDWSVLDANMDVARRHGLKFIVKIADRSFNGRNPMPHYFPSQYILWSSGNGNHGAVSKRWDPYVYNRLIRLHKAIANRYADHSGFGGIATAETATGYFSGGDYSISKYRHALNQVVTQTQAALKRGRLFFYQNFLRGGENSDMNKDQRVKLLRDVPHHSLVVGAPDITPDVQGMPRSVTNYRLHTRRTMPGLSQFCHYQHVDQGQFGRNIKTNKHRQAYYDEIARVREREKQWWFNGTPAVFEYDDLRDPQWRKVKLHPSWVVGDLWQPWELFQYGKRNFDCDYYFWHYREWPASGEFGWWDIRPVILNNQYVD